VAQVDSLLVVVVVVAQRRAEQPLVLVESVAREWQS
jgi:hypothetical protein